MQNQRTLIVGTTSDYIELLRHKHPANSLLFVTDPVIRDNAIEERPSADEELLCKLNGTALENHEMVIRLLHQHIAFYGIALKGIVCFDCESMTLASHIAAAFGLLYPSVAAVMACRDKSITRKLWHADGVPTPQYAKTSSAIESVAFFKNQNKGLPCVLKPVDSSGSERVFRCSTAEECENAYNIIRKPQQSPDIIIEACVDGTEYSCDFIVDSIFDHNKSYTSYTIDSQSDKMNSQSGKMDSQSSKLEDFDKIKVVPVRLTRKIHSPIPVFGTIMAYEVVNFNSVNFDKADFLSILERAAMALGITRGICMVDFIVTNNGGQHGCPFLLEMTPRPGGDCLPWLIQRSMNIDILKLAIDFAGERDFIFNKYSIDGSGLSGSNHPSFYESLVGLRIHANKAGTLNSIDISMVESDPRVREVFIKHKAGHCIILPPENYDSWNLGHIIFKPFEDIPCKEQCIKILSMLKTEIM